jgi:excisionase family DNA binding protein
MPMIQMPDPSRDMASTIDRMTGLLTATELFPLIGVSRTTIYQMVADGGIPYLRIGTMIRFDPHAIAEWLREHTVAA